MKEDIILLLTHSKDFYTIDKVKNALIDLGANPIRVNTDLFPQQLPLEIGFEGGEYKIIADFKEGKVDFSDVAGVWYRRIWKPVIDSSIDPVYREMCVRESRSIFNGTFPFLKNAVWKDPFENVENASNKLLQLKVASEIGFKTPGTLISNKPEAVKDFYYCQNENIITKMAMPTAYGMGHEALAMKTYPLEKEHLEDLLSLQYCPMIFQEEIQKYCELRVIYIDGIFFTAAIDASKSESGKTDWRLSGVNEVKWEKFELPEEQKTHIIKLMDVLDLTFGAIDIIKTPQDEYVFLEVNPVGEWGMLQRDLNYPIAENIAKSLWNRIKNK